MDMNNADNEMLTQNQQGTDKSNTRAEQWNKFLNSEKVQTIKQNSKQYLSYALNALAHPYRTMTLSQSTQLSNAVITTSLIAFLSAVYCFIWFCKLGLRSAFFSRIFKAIGINCVRVGSGLWFNLCCFTY